MIPETSEDSASSCSAGQSAMFSGKKDGPFLTGIDGKFEVENTSEI